jgi:hypothetical protein
MPRVRKGLPVDRRLTQRFPLHLDVRYRTISEHRARSGNGWTVNMSSGGILIAAADAPTLGTLIRASMDWPILLDATVPLQIVITGKVTRSDPSGFALAVQQYRFHTMKRAKTLPEAYEDYLKIAAG